jgi:triose/dihydroxyacetone kinase / FAD-AMP lyase (cyclizing)
MFEEYLLTKQTESQKICLMVNNLGGLSNLEMYLLVNDCYKYFTTNQPACVIKRVYCDSFMTSLSMSGFSLTLLILENSDVDFTLSLLDAKTKAPSWPRSLNKDLKALEFVSTDLMPETVKLDVNKYISFEDNEDLKNLFEATLKQISLDLIKYTDLLNKLDSECGDGDCGSSLAKIAENILKDIDASKFDFNFPHQVISHLSNILENGGGSLCIILSLFASAAAKAFNVESIDRDTKYGDKHYWIRIWKNFVDFGLNDVCEYGKAKPNQRSIVDPLNQIKIYLNDFLVENSGHSVKFNINDFLKELVEVTEKSVNLTAKMRPRVGRASYIDVNIINSPDAGATGILTIINSIEYCLRNN